MEVALRDLLENLTFFFFGLSQVENRRKSLENTRIVSIFGITLGIKNGNDFAIINNREFITH